MARKRSARTDTRSAPYEAQSTEEEEPTKLESRTGKSYIDSSNLIPEILLEFPHSYGVEVLKEISGRGTELHYFPAARHQGCDGILLRITPKSGVSWDGLFAAQPNGRYKSGIYSCPDSATMCVVSNGAGYVLDAGDPDSYQEMPIFPVMGVVPEVNVGLLLLTNYTDVLAWGDSGKRWLAERVSFDGIRRLHIDGATVRGLAWSPVDSEQPFALDLTTGVRLSSK